MSQIKQIIRLYNPYARATTTVDKLNFNHYKEISPIWSHGRYMDFCNDDKWQVEICREHNRDIHFVCQDDANGTNGIAWLFMATLIKIFNYVARY